MKYILRVGQCGEGGRGGLRVMVVGLRFEGLGFKEVWGSVGRVSDWGMTLRHCIL